jgi:two-component system phosphate regulon response regulator PhoB
MLEEVRPPKVLLVDDDKNMVASMRAFLKRTGYGVLEAYDGPTALEIATRESPDIIILDIEMPGMKGAEVVKRLRADSRTEDIPVIFLTARVDLDAMEVTVEEEAQGYLLKPLSTGDLLLKIEEVLGIPPSTL